MVQTSKGRRSRWKSVRRQTCRMVPLARKARQARSLRKSRIGLLANDGRRNRIDSLGKRGAAAMQPSSNDQRSRMGPKGRKASCGQKSRPMGGVMVTTRNAAAARKNEAIAIAVARLCTAVAEGAVMEVGGGGRHRAAAAAALRGVEAGSVVIARTSAVVALASATACHVGGSTATVPMGRTVVLVIGPGMRMMLLWAAPGLGADLEEKTVVMAFADHDVAIHV